jgi:hypothetical protein
MANLFCLRFSFGSSPKIHLNSNNNEDDSGDYDDDYDNNNNNSSSKPDIIIRDNEKGTCMLIDIAILADRNVIKKEAENILKYKDLTTEIQRMWNVRTRVIPVIIGATGTIGKSFRKYVSDIPGNLDVKELQKTAIFGTAHKLRKVLM